MGSWPSSARRSPMRTTPCARATRRSGCRTPCGATRRSCAADRAWRCRSASASTPATSWCARSAAICAWTTPPWARPRIWRRAWNNSRRPAASGSPSRLFWELIHSHRVHGWLIVQSASVSYGKATAYLPVIELLRGYFEIESRDDPRKIREKVTGKVLTLAPALAPVVPAFLALLDVPVEEAAWQALAPLQRRQPSLDAATHQLLH